MSNSNFGFLALALRQRLIKRWSLMHSVQPESVLEHSAVVTLLSYLAGNIAIQRGKSVDLAVMLAHASLHDAAEVLCSDVVTPVKKANAVLQREFERLEKAAEDKLIQTLPEELQDAVAIAFAPGGYEQSLVKACDTYSAYIKCKLEVAAGNGLEFQDALSKMERVVAQVKSDFPEIDALDKWFGDGLGHSVDKLLAVRIPVKLNSDSGICEHHFRKVCGQGFFEQKLSFEGRHLFDSLNKPAAKRSAAVVDPRRWNRTVHLTSEYVH